MKCPYCNKTLKQIKFVDTFTCLNPMCKKALGMTGTIAMWEKISQLVKIRNAGKKYSQKTEVKQKRAEQMAQKYASDPEYRKRIYKNNRKYRQTKKEKIAERNKKYRETHKEYFREYMKNYYKKKKEKENDNQCKTASLDS